MLPMRAHPLARPEFDSGAAPESMPVKSMFVVLKRSAEQQSALDSFLAAVQRPGAPEFHRWLTPEDFGARFGAADSDIQAVAAWLASQGLNVKRISKGKTVIEFSGTVGSVQKAFQTSLRRFTIQGKDYFAATKAPSVPAALAPVIGGVTKLNTFQSRAAYNATAPLPLSGGNTHALGPEDFATIYNAKPVYSGGVDGTGATVAVVARSNIDLNDVAMFRSFFGLPTNPPSIVLSGEDPGIVTDGSEVEATLDVSWAGALAPGASIQAVVGGSDAFVDGVQISELAIIDSNQADVLSESFGVCEFNVDQFTGMMLDANRQQAAAQGITMVISTGDTGAWACEDPNELTLSPVATPAVSALASSPLVTAVGGTMFNEGGNFAQYWSTTNDAKNGSALSYIPEVPWSDYCSTGDACLYDILGGGGGPSTVYSKPAYQANVPGIPQDGARDIPDVSLSAAGHDPYVICLGSCPQFVYGTSASAPSFAGIVALIRQKTKTRQGAINSTLYSLAANENYSACASVGPPASNCIFNDITTGSSQVDGDPNAGTAQALYPATFGYDLATGLGSVNIANLVNNWAGIGTIPTTTALSVNPITVTHGTSARVNVTVTGTGGTGSPTGFVALEMNSGAAIDSAPLTLGTASFETNLLPGGTYQAIASYPGDSQFAPSTSMPVSLTVAPESTMVMAYAITRCEAAPYCIFNGGSYGTPVTLNVTAYGLSNFGNATGTFTFTDNGNPLTVTVNGNSITTASVGALGTLSVTPAMPFAVGSHSIVAIYSGDASFMPASSAPITFTIQATGTSVSVSTNPSCGTPGTAMTLSATVTGATSSVAPTGSVTFLVNGVPVGSAVTVDGSGAATASYTPTASGTLNVTAVYSGDGNNLSSTGANAFDVSSNVCIAAIVNSASFGTNVAVGSQFTILGTQLANATVFGQLPLSSTLADATVSVVDYLGVSSPVTLSYASATQINAVLPSTIAYGPAYIQIANSAGSTQIPIFIDFEAPGLYNAVDSNGHALAAGIVYSVDASGNMSMQSTVTTDSNGKLIPAPISFSSGSTLTLAMFGTGFDFAGSANVLFAETGVAIPQYFGSQMVLPGLDQVNVDLSPNLAGSGLIAVQLFTDGYASNVVYLDFE